LIASIGGSSPSNSHGLSTKELDLILPRAIALNLFGQFKASQILERTFAKAIGVKASMRNIVRLCGNELAHVFQTPFEFSPSVIGAMALEVVMSGHP
jgi:hypothetical protein